MLAVHAAACLFVDRPDWEETLGGRWVPETSRHPELGVAQVHLEPHPITEGVAEFEVLDERYTDLRVVYDALGHDPRSYDSVGRCELLRREVVWLLGR